MLAGKKMNKFNLFLCAVVVGAMSVSSWVSADTGAADELIEEEMGPISRHSPFKHV